MVITKELQEKINSKIPKFELNIFVYKVVNTIDQDNCVYTFINDTPSNLFNEVILQEFGVKNPIQFDKNDLINTIKNVNRIVITKNTNEIINEIEELFSWDLNDKFYRLVINNEKQSLHIWKNDALGQVLVGIRKNFENFIYVRKNNTYLYLDELIFNGIEFEKLIEEFPESLQLEKNK